MQALFDQAVTFHKAGKLQEAVKLYAQLLQRQPEHPLINARMATALSQAGNAGAALKHYDLAIRSLPNEIELLMQATGLATQVGDNDRAEKWLRQVLASEPKHQAANEQLAGVLVALHREDEALKHVKIAIQGNPQSASAYNLKGVIEARFGETEKGYKCFQKALKLNPGQLAVVRNLVIYGKGRKEPLLDQIIPQLEHKYQATNLPPNAKSNLAYILFMYYEKSSPEKAFNFLKEGNDLNRANYQYSHTDTQKTFAKLINGMSDELQSRFEGKGLEDDSAIFILGMPRSGTTLVEQILSSHSRVGAEGEIKDLVKHFERLDSVLLNDKASMDEKVSSCLQVAQAYLDGVRVRQSAPYFTDKMPYNFMMLGFIAMAMPNAKIIHCTRDPLETCYSIYKQNFSGSHAYTNNLEEVGRYFNLYQAMMKHWQAMFPNRIYQVNYEQLVAQPEAEIASLLAHCKLEVEPQCLAFYKNKRAVRTASVAQVRQPIYKDALKASAAVERQLAPLAKILASGEGGDWRQ